MNIGRKAIALGAGLIMTLSSMAQTQIIAHRGYWDCAGSAQNSITSLQLADKIGVYGSEFDVHLTKDGKILVHHDPTVGSLIIEKNILKDLRKIPLRNGEVVPTLDEYLDAAKSLTTRLILEIKQQSNKTREDSLVSLTVAMVKAKGLEARTEYISFSGNACERLRKLCPDAVIYYLNGDWSPKEIKAKGLNGIDYEQTVMALHPEWIKECHDLGLKVNVWTVNDLNTIDQFIKEGVDFVTTNRPVEALKLAK